MGRFCRTTAVFVCPPRQHRAADPRALVPVPSSAPANGSCSSMPRGGLAGDSELQTRVSWSRACVSNRERSILADHATILNWIDEQRPVMHRRVVRWCDINSGTGNLAGLQRLTAELWREFAVLGGTGRELPLAAAQSI